MYHMVTLRQFRQFLAVAETMGFGKAAERLNMAQPPLTAAIRKLEEEIGCRLFERTNRIVSLTAAGSVLKDEAQRAIAQAERAVLLARRAGAGESGSLRIGFVASAARRLIPELVAAFRQSRPSVELKLEEATTARQVAALLNDHLDVGIVSLPLPAGADEHISAKVIAKGHLVAAIPASHSLANEPSAVDLAALADEPWILFPPDEGPGLHATILRACAVAGFVPGVTQQALQMETIAGLVAAGFGVALVPEAFREAGYRGVVFRELKGPGAPVPSEVGLVWRRGAVSPVLSSFIRTASER